MEINISGIFIETGAATSAMGYRWTYHGYRSPCRISARTEWPVRCEEREILSIGTREMKEHL